MVTIDVSPPDWRRQALCAQTDPESFFPDKAGPVETAVAVCRRCPVRAECLSFALENGEEFGIWGGMTEAERREVLREQQQAGDGLGRVPGLCARGDGRWAVTAYYRRPGGGKGQVSTTVTGDRNAALRTLDQVRARAVQLAAGETGAISERAA